MAEVSGWRRADGWFAPSDIRDTFQALRIPGPNNPTQRLQRLAGQRFVLSRGRGAWSLTPLGQKRVVDLVGSIDPARVAPQLAKAAGATLGHELHTVIPPEFAPIRWAAGIGRLLHRFPFERNVFCMTRYPEKTAEETPDPIKGVIESSRGVLDGHGLVLHLASDRAADDELFGNVAAHMWACKFGLGLFEDRVERKLNYNLVIEVGSMIMTGRRCALVKDRTVPAMPTDLVGQIYKNVDFDDAALVRSTLHRWVRDDLGLGGCPECPN